MESSYDISIILVNYKTPQLLLDCISSIVAETGEVRYEIIVVDNNSADESEELVRKNYPQVRWVNTGYNAGFARANNVGIRIAQGTYSLLLNSDTIVKEKAIVKSLHRYQLYEQTTNIGLLGCQIVHFDGYVQYNSNQGSALWSKLRKSNPFYILIDRVLHGGRAATIKADEEQQRLRSHQTEHETGWLGGAFLLFNTAKITGQDALLDEDFFMYCEDQEWCLRLKAMGMHHYFYPGAYILHAEGGSFTVKEGKYKQIILSEWLLILKLYGVPGYVAYLTILIINQLTDGLLYLKSRKGTNAPAALQQCHIRQWKWQMIRQYGWRILRQYRSKPSAAAHYLKYGE